MKKSEKKYFLTADKVKIYYETHRNKTKKALVFLHGLGGDLTVWDKEREYFHSKGVSTIALDLRGHGFLDKSNNKEFYSMANFAEDAHSIMQYEKFDSYTTIGHCFGGMISMILESKYQGSSKNLVLIDTSYKAPNFTKVIKNNWFIKNLVEMIINVLPTGHKGKHIDFNLFINTKDVDLPRILSDILHVSLKSYLLICEKLVDYDATRLLKRIIIPTLVVEGLNDSIFPPKIALKLKNRIKKAKLDLIPNANHIIVINNPEELSKDIESFLSNTHFF